MFQADFLVPIGPLEDIQFPCVLRVLRGRLGLDMQTQFFVVSNVIFQFNKRTFSGGKEMFSFTRTLINVNHFLYILGPELFYFALKVVTFCVKEFLHFTLKSSYSSKCHFLRV